MTLFHSSRKAKVKNVCIGLGVGGGLSEKHYDVRRGGNKGFGEHVKMISIIDCTSFLSIYFEIHWIFLTDILKISLGVF